MAVLPVAAAPPPTPAPAAPAGPSAPRGARSFGGALEARLPPAAGPGPTPHAPSPRRAGLAPLEAVERAQARLDAVLSAARSGRTFSAQELLSLQACAYRHVQAVELASKVVESAAQTVKQAVNTQL